MRGLSTVNYSLWNLRAEIQCSKLAKHIYWLSWNITVYAMQWFIPGISLLSAKMNWSNTGFMRDLLQALKKILLLQLLLCPELPPNYVGTTSHWIKNTLTDIILFPFPFPINVVLIFLSFFNTSFLPFFQGCDLFLTWKAKLIYFVCYRKLL